MSAADDIAAGLADLAGLISFRVAAWHDLGYETPPAPESKPVPPLGGRSAEAVKAGHEAIEAIDELTRQLRTLRAQLAGELRQDEDLRAARAGVPEAADIAYDRLHPDPYASWVNGEPPARPSGDAR